MYFTTISCPTSRSGQAADTENRGPAAVRSDVRTGDENGPIASV